MIKSNASLQPKSRKSLIVHRLMLLASVAGLGTAVFWLNRVATVAR
jgi:hypothetical protein